MKVAPDNIFPGARVKLGNVDYTVIKVNAKSFYATTMSFAEYKTKWDSRLKGTTFVNFCQAYEIGQYKYSDSFEIDTDEFGRKIVAEENSKSEYKIDKHDKAALLEIINERKKKGKVRLTPQVSLNSIKRVFFLEENNNCYLANMDDDYVMFAPDIDEWIKISTVYDFLNKYDHVPWELLSCFEAGTKVEAVA